LPESISNHPAIRYLPMGRCMDDAGAIARLDGLWRSGKH
jgi:hypothetical protein